MKTKFGLYAVCFPLVLLLSGCALFLIGAGVAAGVGGVVYVKGELVVSEAVTMDTAWAATEKTLKDLKFNVVKADRTGTASLMEARGAGDKKVMIKLKKTADKVTEFRIRVGLVGDETESRQIHEKIKAAF